MIAARSATVEPQTDDQWVARGPQTKLFHIMFQIGRPAHRALIVGGADMAPKRRAISRRASSAVTARAGRFRGAVTRLWQGVLGCGHSGCYTATMRRISSDIRRKTSFQSPRLFCRKDGGSDTTGYLAAPASNPRLLVAARAAVMKSGMDASCALIAKAMSAGREYS